MENNDFDYSGFSEEDIEYLKGLKPLSFEEVNQGYTNNNDPFKSIRIKNLKKGDFKLKWEWLQYNSRPHTIFYDTWKDEKNDFIIPSYYTKDWADNYLAYCDGFEDYPMWIFDGAEIFNGFKIPKSKLFKFNEKDKPLKLLSFTYPKGVWAEKYKDKLLISNDEIITFFELDKDNSVNIYFRFGKDFKDYLSKHFKDNNIIKNVFQLENAEYKTDVKSVQDFFAKEVFHQKNMEFIFNKLGVKVLNKKFLNIKSDYFKPEDGLGPEDDFVSVWWTYDYEGKEWAKWSDIHNEHFSAYLEETVYFQINVNKEVPVGTIIKFTIFDRDGFLNFDDYDLGGNQENSLHGTVREIEDELYNRITLKLYLDPKWKEDIESDSQGLLFKDSNLEINLDWEYYNATWSTYEKTELNVRYSQRDLIVKEAYYNYALPEIRTSNGEILVFSIGIGVDEKKSTTKDLVEFDKAINVIKDHGKEKLLDYLAYSTDKIRHTIAIRQLKKGKIVTNTEKTHFNSKIYAQPIYDNSGNLFTVTKAANFGYRENGEVVTTKGISQLNYFRDTGMLNTSLKMTKEALGVFDFIDLAGYLAGKKPDYLPTPFVALDLVVALIMPTLIANINEIEQMVFDELIEEAKDLGIKKGIKKLPLTNIGKEYDIKLYYVDATVLAGILRGKIRKKEEIDKYITDDESKQFILLTYIIIENELLSYRIIDSIFIKNI